MVEEDIPVYLADLYQFENPKRMAAHIGGATQ
jgi:hypothetical protein